jgi:hypothetical protein
MLDLKLTFHASCPKHPCYQPREGRGAIKGGCIYCEALYRITQAETPFLQAIGEFQRLMDRYNEKHMPKAKRKPVEPVQPVLFEMEASNQ